MNILEMQTNKRYQILKGCYTGCFKKGDIIIKNIENDIIWVKYSGWINILDIPQSIIKNVKIQEIGGENNV
jgi:hypothetical protein